MVKTPCKGDYMVVIWDADSRAIRLYTQNFDHGSLSTTGKASKMSIQHMALLI